MASRSLCCPAPTSMSWCLVHFIERLNVLLSCSPQRGSTEQHELSFGWLHCARDTRRRMHTREGQREFWRERWGACGRATQRETKWEVLTIWSNVHSSKFAAKFTAALFPLCAHVVKTPHPGPKAAELCVCYGSRRACVCHTPELDYEPFC